MATDNTDTRDTETHEPGGSIEELTSRVDRLEALVASARTEPQRRQPDPQTPPGGSACVDTRGGSRPDRGLSRRETLAAGGVLALLGLGSGHAAAQQGRDNGGQGGAVYEWQRTVDANGHDLTDLGGVSMAANAEPIADFAGENLSIDDDGVLHAAAGTAQLRGETIPLDIIRLGDDILSFPIEADPGEFIPLFDRVVVPFPAFDLPYISRLYLQFFSEVSADDDTVVRLTSGGEERWRSGTYQFGLIEGRRIDYWGDFEYTTVRLAGTLEDRPSDDTTYTATFSNATLIVWGEVG